MEGIEAAAILLWGMTFALGGFATAEAGMIDVGDDRFLSVDVETDFADVAIDGLGEDDSPNATVEAAGIDDGVERDAGTGLCAVGFDAEESPVGVAVDGDESAVEVEADSEYDPDDVTHPHDGKTAQEIVAECAASPEDE